MEEKKEKPKASKAKKTATTKFRKILFFLFLCLFLVLLFSYAALTIISLNKSLPMVNLMGNDMGLRSSSDINKYIKKISEANMERVIEISNGSESVTKKISDFGVEIDTASTTREVLSFGKKFDILPNFSYFKKILSHKASVEPVFTWEGDVGEKITKNTPNNQKVAENAKFIMVDSRLSIESEKSGYELDLDNFMDSVEGCLANGCPDGIKTQTKTAPATVNSTELTPLLDKLAEKINTSLTLNAKEKRRKYTVDSADLISFIDIEQSVKKNALWWDETKIEEYLKKTIAPKINVNGKSRKISTYDNSVISEGTQGYGLQLDKSKQAVKETLINGENIAALSIGITPVEEEYVNPGFTPNRVEGKYIDVNLTEQKLYTLEGGKLVNSYRVSTGKWSMPTPVGEYSINSKDPKAYSRQYDLYMPYWMAFIGHGYGIHELPETSSGRKEGESSLGVPVSHGCVRLGVGAAEEVYNWAEVGTPIFIHR